MEYTLGQKFVHPIGGEKEGVAKVIAIRKDVDSVWEVDKHFEDNPELLEFLEDTYENVVLFGEMDWEEGFITPSNLKAYDRYDDDINWSVLVTEDEYEKRQEVTRKIVELLKANDIDTKNLIVSDDQVYQGYNQCADYIQTTYAWCSSSMSC